MKTMVEASNFEIIFQSLWRIWEPACKALNLQNELEVHSLEETQAAVERAGYEICHVDLPERVSGFAEIIADKPHIVLNRQKSPQNLHYTLPHELGHHILHLNPAGKSVPQGFPGVGKAELEADLFATSWLLCLEENKQRDGVLLQNPESARTIVIYLILSVATVVLSLCTSLMLRQASETQ